MNQGCQTKSKYTQLKGSTFIHEHCWLWSNESFLTWVREDLVVTKIRGWLTTQFRMFLAGVLSSGCVDLRSSIMGDQRQGWCGLCRAGAWLRRVSARQPWLWFSVWVWAGCGRENTRPPPNLMTLVKLCLTLLWSSLQNSVGSARREET